MITVILVLTMVPALAAENADMNEDGQVTIFDAIRILQTVAH